MKALKVPVPKDTPPVEIAGICPRCNSEMKLGAEEKSVCVCGAVFSREGLQKLWRQVDALERQKKARRNQTVIQYVRGISTMIKEDLQFIQDSTSPGAIQAGVKWLKQVLGEGLNFYD